MSKSNSNDSKETKESDPKGFKLNKLGTPVEWNGDNWNFYKSCMLIVFEENDVDEIALGQLKLDPAWGTRQKTDFKKKQATIKRLILQSLAHRLACILTVKTMTGTEMWKELASNYEGKDNKAVLSHKIHVLTDKLMTTTLKPCGDVRSHLYVMFQAYEQLKELNEPFSDSQMRDCLLRSLPSSPGFDALKTKVFFSDDLSVYTPEKLREMIITADIRSKDWEQGRAFGTRIGSSDGSKQGSKQQKHGKGKRFKPKANSGPQRNLDEVECYKCHNKGHYAPDCPDQHSTSDDSAVKSKGTKKSAHAKVAKVSKKQTSQHQAKMQDERDLAVRQDADETIPPVLENHDADSSATMDKKKQATIGELPPCQHWTPSTWILDTGCNAHIASCRDQFVTLDALNEDEWEQKVSGFAPGIEAHVKGIGTVMLPMMIDDKPVVMFLEGVLYVPSAGCNLFSPGLALKQGFKLGWSPEAESFSILKDGEEVIRTQHCQNMWKFEVCDEKFAVLGKNDDKSNGKQVIANLVIVNFVTTDGVADSKTWHNRLGHTCLDYLKLMVDGGHVRGMMLLQRTKMDCDECHFGKQKRKPFLKKLERNIKQINDVIFADLLFPGRNNATRFTAVLVVMDGFSRFVKVYFLRTKSEAEVNQCMRKYIAWAERQTGMKINHVIQREWINSESDVETPVKQVLTDRGTEFCNREMEAWYEEKGIIHTKVGPKGSHLNPVERMHQSLMNMVRSMMHQSGFPRSLWPEALETAAYLRNRTYSKVIRMTPYERMFNEKPDLHYLRTFGAQAFVFVPSATSRSKLKDHCQQGFVLGYREDVMGCNVYFPTERIKRFVADVQVNESIMYRDRHLRIMTPALNNGCYRTPMHWMNHLVMMRWRSICRLMTCLSSMQSILSPATMTMKT